MDLRNTLKALKLNEGTISTLLGALVVIVVLFLVINFLRGRGGEEVPPGQVTSTTQEQVTLPATHTVADGEHLWGIAERYFKSGYNWVDIAEANELTNPNRLEVGQELTIPEVEPKTATVDAGETGLTVFGPAIEGNSYTVEQGDHLWGIAVRAYGDGFQWTGLAEANNLENPNILLIGQELTIPRE